MSPEQHRIVAAWERHERAQPGVGVEYLFELVSSETSADLDTIVGALVAKNAAVGAVR